MLGSIWVAGALDDDRPLIEQAARVVALDLLKDRAVAEVERRAGRELLDALLAEDPTVDAGLQRRAGELAVDLSVPHRILALRGGGEEALRALRTQRWCAFVAEYGPFVLALVPGSETGMTESLRAVIDGTVRAVLSAPCGTRRRLPSAVPRGAPCARAARRFRDGAPVIDLDDAWVLTLLAQGGNDAELRRFSRLAARSPLIRHDAEHCLGLIGTLEAYLDADRSPTRARAPSTCTSTPSTTGWTA